MNWYSTVVLWMAVIDAGLVMLGGLAMALARIRGVDAQNVWAALWPAEASIIVSTILAAGILGAAHLMV